MTPAIHRWQLRLSRAIALPRVGRDTTPRDAGYPIGRTAGRIGTASDVQSLAAARVLQ
jgi:hypothetical protein